MAQYDKLNQNVANMQKQKPWRDWILQDAPRHFLSMN
jgi:hypothetical protein